MTTKQHERRYKSAVERITPKRVAAVKDRILKQNKWEKTPKADGSKNWKKYLELLLHKLGIRKSDESTVEAVGAKDKTA